MRMLVLPVIVFTVGVASCERAPADAAQLIARVNGVEISAHEIRTNGGATVAQAVEKVIDRELLVQKALEAGLERDALVKDSIDNVRRQVLAQAYLERTAGGATRPSREEVRAFYAENPALFAERRVYRMRELVVSANAELVDALRSQATRAADLDEVAAWLKSRNVTFSAASETQPAEQLPLAFLPQMARMKAGEITVFQTPASAQSSTNWQRQTFDASGTTPYIVSAIYVPGMTMPRRPPTSEPFCHASTVWSSPARLSWR